MQVTKFMYSSLNVGLKIIMTSGGCVALLLFYTLSPAHIFYSKYNHSTAASREQQYHDTEALPAVGRAVWQLMLAMLAKIILTIFTFGMKVCTLYHQLPLVCV